jgi:hypothetical protein
MRLVTISWFVLKTGRLITEKRTTAMSDIKLIELIMSMNCRDYEIENVQIS